MTNNYDHWAEVYADPTHQGSWFRSTLQESVDAIRTVAPTLPCDYLDVGAGRQRLVPSDVFGEGQTARAYALDMSLEILGPPCRDITYLVGDVLTVALPHVDVWHDRAVLHFFTDSGDRARYREQVRRTVRPGGGLVVACFDSDGPERCSGLPVARRSPSELADEFSDDFSVVELRHSDHVTPSGAVQRFAWFLGRRL